MSWFKRIARDASNAGAPCHWSTDPKNQSAIDNDNSWSLRNIRSLYVTSLTPASYHAASARSSSATYQHVGLPTKYCISKLSCVVRNNRTASWTLQRIPISYYRIFISFPPASRALLLPIAFTCPSYHHPPQPSPSPSVLVSNSSWAFCRKIFLILCLGSAPPPR